MANQSSRSRIIPLCELPEGSGGGKAAGLWRLHRLGLNIPRTLVVLDAHRGLPAEDLAEAWQAFGGGTAAVRSSGADEDSEALSAAGQFETILNVKPEALTDAVLRCAASAGESRVETYGKQLSGKNTGAMAVVIQEMVDPLLAGVIFTADPLSGDRDVMIVEAVAGLGEKLVSGQAEASRFMLSAIPGGTAAGKDETLDRSADFVREAPPSTLSGMTEEILENLRAGAALAAAEWGMAMDMEWAVDVKGDIHWLQARPITALADSLDSVVAADELITRCNIGEMMPGAVTPLTYSTFGKSLSTGLADYYRSFGALRRSEPDPSFIESFDEQLFMNLTSMYLMSRRVLGASAEGTELSILGYVLPPHDIGPLAPWPVRLYNGIRYFGGLFGWKKKVGKLERLARNFHIETHGKTAAQILAGIRSAHRPGMDRAVELHYGASAFSGAMNAALAMTLSGAASVSDQAKQLMTDLLAGVEGVESAAVLEGLSKLAEIILAANRQDILNGDIQGIHLRLLEDSGDLGIFYRNFIERHGHRCIREAELREPEWAVKPDHLIESLRALVDSAAAGKVRRALEPQNHPLRAGRKPARPGFGREPSDIHLPEGVNPRAVKWIAKQSRRGVRVREYSKSLLIKVIHQFKIAARALGRRLEDESLLPEADLCYFLTLEELENLVGGAGEGLVARARRRHRRYPEKMELRFPDLSKGRPQPEAPAPPDGTSTMKGTPVSRGIAEGSVRVVKTLSDAEGLQAGEIMVAQFTDIGWTPFYGRVAGMITEIGGALSHGSVVAREYGMPLVGGLSGACSVLKTGMRVRIDGGIGAVTILEEERTGEPALR